MGRVVMGVTGYGSGCCFKEEVQGRPGWKRHGDVRVPVRGVGP